MEIKPPTIEDGQTIEYVRGQIEDYLTYMLVNGQPYNLGSFLLDCEKAIEAYCTERERLARADEWKWFKGHAIQNFGVTGNIYSLEALSFTIENRIYELQAQSNSQEADEPTN